MRKKYKVTPFTRFLIFLVIFTPLAYMGASYYNGEDGIENIKNFFGINKDNTASIADDAPALSQSELLEQKDQEIMMLKETIRELRRQLDETNSVNN